MQTRIQRVAAGQARAAGKPDASTALAEAARQPGTVTASNQGLQRLLRSEVPGEALDTAEAARAAAHGGEPLPGSVRDFFEPRFGQDFSQVRVHADSQAEEAARAVQARAYTLGSHVVFGSGQYAPFTADGQRLLAHELTHVVQQGGSVNPVTLQRQRRTEARPPARPQAPRRPPFVPPRGRWVLVSLNRIGRGAGGRGRVRVYNGFTLQHTFHAAGGQTGHSTPTGSFTIDFRDPGHESSEYGECVQGRTRRRVGPGGARNCRPNETYDGADMHFFQRFAPRVGFHVGDAAAVSHGCIHLSRPDASTLWRTIGEGTRVIVCAGAECRWYVAGILAARREAERQAAEQRAAEQQARERASRSRSR